MSTNVTRRHQADGTDEAQSNERPTYRPTYFLLGEDTEGSHHVADLLTDSVHVVTPAGGREHRQPLNGHPLEAYMGVIADGRGWDRELYGLGIGGMVSRAVDLTV